MRAYDRVAPAAQHIGSDCVQMWTPNKPLFILAAALLLALTASGNCFAADIDATNLHHKVLCGYQGWFRCPGDPINGGWGHWSRNGREITPDSLTFEMWPDMS